MSYRTGSCFYVPNRKSELIAEIIKSERWNGTKQALRDMETKQIRAIFIKIRNEIYSKAFKKDSINTNTKTEVKNE